VPLIDERLARAQVQVAELARRHRFDVDPKRGCAICRSTFASASRF
jgi:hypothetical protein